MQPTHSALIVAVPQSEAVVGPYRAALDPAATWVPAHITVLYPFLAPHLLDEPVLSAVRDIVAAQPRMRVSLSHVGWFGDTVVWLAPQPDEPLRRLTQAVWRRFPEAPPYDGAFDDVVPHLTIGHGAPRPVLAEAADAVAAHLPIHAEIDTVRLICGSPHATTGPWQTLAEFPLGHG